MANLYTKTGDKGQTSLVGGSRVSKSDLRVDCYGTIDEFMSMLGLAYAQCDREYIRTALNTIQKRLFILGAEFASDAKGAARLKDTICTADIEYLESVVDYCTLTTGRQRDFVVPGVDVVSATLHVARTIIRRAERKVVLLSQSERVREELSRYVNRLSDAIYALARLQEELVAQDTLREQVTELVAQAMCKVNVSTSAFTLENIQKMAERAKAKGEEIGVPVVFSAVDEGGNLVLLQRMEGALLGSIDVSIGKAYTANAFKMPTHTLGELAQPEGMLYGIQDATPGKIILFGGGFPYEFGGKVVGGIGVSGGTVEQDIIIASAALGV